MLKTIIVSLLLLHTHNNIDGASYVGENNQTPSLGIPVAVALGSSLGTSIYIAKRYGFFALKTSLKNICRRWWRGNNPLVEWDMHDPLMKEWLESLERLVRDLGYMYITRVEKVDDTFVEATYVTQKGSRNFARTMLVGICKKVLLKKWQEKDIGRIIGLQSFRPVIEEFVGPENMPYTYAAAPPGHGEVFIHADTIVTDY